MINHNSKKVMMRKAILPTAVILSVCSIVLMAVALTSGNGKKKDAIFTPPPFDAAAQSGVPEVDASLGWSEVYQDGMSFRAYVCGNVLVHGDRADVWFTNCEGFPVWLKLRILDSDGNLLGETGLLKPGEYVQSVILTSDVTDGQSIKLKIMAYEPDTYYSAGTATLNTVITKGDAG